MAVDEASRKMMLLRFDDICPTMNWAAWDFIEATLVERDIKPVLAITPDNRDPVLKIDPPNADFWMRMRQCQERGWSMALHGYQHCNVSQNAGLAGRRKKSEFAGLSREQQDEKLQQGIDILRNQGINPTVWIAPFHTFDSRTVLLLGNYGIQVISDGFFRYPYHSKEGVLWVPQQIHALGPTPPGVWTVCYHINGWESRDLVGFQYDVDNFRAHITALGEIIGKYGDRRRGWLDRVYFNPRAGYYLTRIELILYRFIHQRYTR